MVKTFDLILTMEMGSKVRFTRDTFGSLPLEMGICTTFFVHSETEVKLGGLPWSMKQRCPYLRNCIYLKGDCDFCVILYVAVLSPRKMI